MAGGNIRAGGAFVEIFGKDMLDKSLRAAAARLKAFGSTVSTIGAGLSAGAAAAAAPLGAMVKVFAETGDAAQKAALRTGMSTNAISELGYAARQSGASLSDVEGSVKRMQSSLVDAAEGSKTAQGALDRLGLSIADLDGMSPDKQFELIADRLAAVRDPAIRAATAMDIFGKSGVNLLPLMASGAEGIRALRDEAIRSGQSIDQLDADAAATLGDAFARVRESLKGAAIQAGAALAPALTALADRVYRVTTAIVEFVKNNRETVVSIAKIVAGVAAAGAGLVALGAVITGTGLAVGAVGAAFAGITAALSALLSPVGLVIAGITAATVAFLRFTDTGQQMASSVMGAFASVGQFIGETFSVVRDLLLSGEWSKAGEIAMLSLKVAVQKGVFALQEIWVGLKNAFLTTWTNLTASIQNIWSRTQEFLTKGILRIWGMFDKTLDTAAAIKIVTDDASERRRQNNAEAAAANARRELQYGEQLNKARRDLADIEAERAKAIEQAKKDVAEIQAKPILPKAVEVPDLTVGLQQLGDQQRRVSEGTFLAAAASRLGGSQTIEREQLGAIEEVTAAVDRLRKTVENNPLAFA